MAKEAARLEISYARRVVGLALQGGLGLFLLYVAAISPGGGVWGKLVLAAGGAGLLWLAYRFWQSAGTALLLTYDGLESSDGRHLCRIEDIEKVDRGFFAFRPTAGFLIICKQNVPRGWRPGLWWAYGRKIGVGGATSRPAGKQMADILGVMLTERGAEIRAENR